MYLLLFKKFNLISYSRQWELNKKKKKKWDDAKIGANLLRKKFLTKKYVRTDYIIGWIRKRYSTDMRNKVLQCGIKASLIVMNIYVT